MANFYEFGNFALGDFSEFGDSSAANYGPSTGRTVISAGGPNGGNYARMTIDDGSTLYGDTSNNRIHLIGFPGVAPSWFNTGGSGFRAISMRVPTASGVNSAYVYAGPEVHADNGTGPAPNGTGWQRGGYWQPIARGGHTTDGNFDKQWSFGPPAGSIDSQHANADWLAGNKLVVLDQWVHFREDFVWDTTNGSYTLSVWDVNSGSWIIQGIKSGIPTSYPDKDGNTLAIYPMISLYQARGNGKQVLDVAAGYWASTSAQRDTWQNTRLGLTPNTPPNTGTPPSTPAFDTSFGLAGVGDTRNITLPSGIQLILVKTGTYFDAGAMTVTYNGVPLTQKLSVSIGNVAFQQWFYGVGLVADGTAHSLAITNPNGRAMMVEVQGFSGIDTSTPFRSQGSFDYATNTLNTGTNSSVSVISAVNDVAVDFIVENATTDNTLTATGSNANSMTSTRAFNGAQGLRAAGSTIAGAASVALAWSISAATQAMHVGVSIKSAPSLPVPTLSITPDMTGSTPVGSVLTSNHGTWTNNPTSYAYQWTADGNNIVGQNAVTYTSVVGDVGKVIRCAVIATNATGSSLAAASTGVTPTAVPTGSGNSRWNRLFHGLPRIRI